jgi:flavin-binding protein dodecin
MAAAARLRQVALVCYATDRMAVARVTEIVASSPDGFREAVDEGLARASRTLRGITGLEVLGKRVKVERGLIVEYRVEMKITFLLDEI